MTPIRSCEYDFDVNLIKKAPYEGTFETIGINPNYDFNLSSEVAVSFFLPLALREASTLLPLGVDILSMNPCLFILFFLEG
jgi:hypothetical protein